MDILKLAFEAEDKIIKWRRHLHENPELSFKEYKTTEYIKGILNKYPNLKVQTITNTGVVAILEGAKPGKTVALRADIDALPINEEADVQYKSLNNGIMHACGHDAHTAMLLGAVDILTKLQEKIEGNIKFIFQPAEEVPPGGAKEMIEAGVLNNVDMVFGLHIISNLPVGMVATAIGSVTASSDVAKILVKGKGSHGSMPEIAIDPILIGSQIICNINNIVSRNVSPFESLVISAGEFTSGKAANIIPDTARIQLSIRSHNEKIRSYAKKRIEEIVKGVCEMYHAQYELEYKEGYGSVVNDAKATEIITNASYQIVGKENSITLPKIMASEDFSAYCEVKPSGFFILGGGSKEDGYGFMNHHPKFKINEEALKYGSAMHAQIAIDALKKHKV